MSERRKQIWQSYFWSLGIAGVISFVFLPVLIKGGGWGGALFMAVLATFAFGTGFFLIGTLREIVRFRSFLVNLIAQTFLLAMAILIPTLFVSSIAIATSNHVPLTDPGVYHALLALLSPSGPQTKISVNTLDGLGVSFLVSLGINACFQISQKIGPGTFGKWITGRYYTPREEERIFMFLDMKDSTAIAERIGNLKYSALVRDFFRDLTYPVLATRGEVSHFIGDEAVLTWKPARGLDKANCVQMFFRMEKALQERSAYYQEQYGFVPEFKAGLHIGPVVATEVGEIKSEIVFHGDVMNTAARIQALCNSEGVGLLMSGELADRLTMPSGLALEKLGPRALKGKEHEVEIVAIEKKP